MPLGTRKEHQQRNGRVGSAFQLRDAFDGGDRTDGYSLGFWGDWEGTGAVRLEQAQLAGASDGFGATVHLQFLDILGGCVPLPCPGPGTAAYRSLSVREPLGDKPEDLQLALAQWLHHGGLGFALSMRHNRRLRQSSQEFRLVTEQFDNPGVRWLLIDNRKAGIINRIGSPLVHEQADEAALLRPAPASPSNCTALSSSPLARRATA